MKNKFAIAALAGIMLLGGCGSTAANSSAAPEAESTVSEESTAESTEEIPEDIVDNGDGTTTLNHLGVLSFTYPSEWTYIDDDGVVYLDMSAGEDYEHYMFLISYSLDDSETDMSLSDYADAWIANFSADEEDFEIGEYTEANYGGVDWITFESFYPDFSEGIDCTVYTALAKQYAAGDENDFVTCVMMAVPSDETEEYTDTFYDFMKTTVFDDTVVLYNEEAASTEESVAESEEE